MPRATAVRTLITNPEKAGRKRKKRPLGEEYCCLFYTIKGFGLTTKKPRSDAISMNDLIGATGTARRADDPTQTTMQVRKRNGSSEPVDINKIVKAISRCITNLPNVDVMRIATKTISGLYDGATTQELDKLSIQTAASLIFEEPEYSRLAARLLKQYIGK